MDQNNQYQGRHKKILIGVGILLLVIAICLIGKHKSAGYYNEKNPRPEITVTGKGEAVAVPNIATFSFSVTETAKTVKEAQDKATEKINKVIAYLKTANIADKDVQTQNYYINPQYDYVTASCIRPCTPGKQVLTGYQVTQTIVVKIRKTEEAGNILTGIGNLGVQNVSGLDLTVDNEEGEIAKARAKAIEDAKLKAQELAKQLGVHLVRITSFSEQGQGYPIYYSKVGLQVREGGADVAVANPAPEIPTGENKITSVVTITYEIR